MPESLPAVSALCALLEQGAELARSLEARHFVGVSPLAPSGSVGAHLRHVADFVQAFLRGLEEGAVDYDRRERDERLEREPQRARAHLLRLRGELECLARRDGEQSLRVRSESGAAGAAWQGSTLARELCVVLSHSVHHYALIAILLRAGGLEPPADLGVAPSTLAHWQQANASCAPQLG